MSANDTGARAMIRPRVDTYIHMARVEVDPGNVLTAGDEIDVDISVPDDAVGMTFLCVASPGRVSSDAQTTASSLSRVVNLCNEWQIA